MFHLTRNYHYWAVILITVLLTACSGRLTQQIRKEIKLDGKWKFALDEYNVGIAEKWYENKLSDEVNLPGTLDENKKGWANTDTSPDFLNRPYYYTGMAWYQKEISIPREWKNKHIELVLERSKVTNVWIDSVLVGSSNVIYSQQVFNLSRYLTPGKHTLTIAVDNREELVPVAGSHAYSENTQTNWNGIIGRMSLEASNKLRIAEVRVTPDIDAKQAKIRVKIEGRTKLRGLVSVTVKAKSWNTRPYIEVPAETFLWPSDTLVNEMELSYSMGDEIRLWSEFNPALYKFEITLNETGVPVDNRFIDFGMREFKTKGTQFTINNQVAFLRGKHDALVFPLTGYPPTDVKSWVSVFRKAQQYGINHYRFHTVTPPEAAFKAADICGIYIQSELPIWWGFKADSTEEVEYLTTLGKHILDAYGNYASFTMFSLGNELSQDRAVLQKMVADLRQYDARPLYTSGSNNRLWDPSWAEGDDFFVSFRAARRSDDFSTDLRTSMSFLDSKGGGILNETYPGTAFNYSKAITNAAVPMVGFEVGQYQVYPNFKEISKYSGVLKPWNLEYYKQQLEKAGMANQAEDFFAASGNLAAICYKADIEAAFRTEGFGGFHLLDLQDYPGQGTSLVGMLDAFMDNKGIIEADQFKNFCNDVVILLEMEKYCWKNSDTLKARILVANYSDEDFTKAVSWRVAGIGLRDALGTDETPKILIKQGGLTQVGVIQIPLNAVSGPERFDIRLSLDTKYDNVYPLWVYPETVNLNTGNIIVANHLDGKIVNQLMAGESVLIFPEAKAIEKFSVGSQFISDFWNFEMFRKLGEQYGGGLSPGTMGILTDPQNPVFTQFPTDFHTNWQWWPMVTNCRSLILDSLEGFKPVVQIIDNINRNHRLGMLMEFKFGEGKLVVCTANLPQLTKYPEAAQLYKSLLEYMQSDMFMPEYEITTKQLRHLGLLR